MRTIDNNIGLNETVSQNNPHQSNIQSYMTNHLNYLNPGINTLSNLNLYKNKSNLPVLKKNELDGIVYHKTINFHKKVNY